MHVCLAESMTDISSNLEHWLGEVMKGYVLSHPNHSHEYFQDVQIQVLIITYYLMVTKIQHVDESRLEVS
jgi:hypothetical protein